MPDLKRLSQLKHEENDTVSDDITPTPREKDCYILRDFTRLNHEFLLRPVADYILEQSAAML
jgi:hypothetical protein